MYYQTCRYRRPSDPRGRQGIRTNAGWRRCVDHVDEDAADGDEARTEAARELRKATDAKRSLLDAEHARLLDQAAKLDAMAASRSANARGRADATALRDAVQAGAR